MKSELWSMKYAPKRVEDVKVNMKKGLKEKIINMKEGKIPHFIFSGVKGSGRTTFATLLAKKRLNNHPEAVKVLSGETSVTKDERKAIKKVAHISKKRLGNYSGNISGFPAFLHARAMEFLSTKPMMIPYKVMVIREFHHIDSQESFRRVMERYEYCRMMLISSNPSAIIDPIVSRCVYIQCKKVKVLDFLEEINRVAKGEGIEIPLNASKLLYSLYGGNIGASINAIQFHYLKNGEITRELIKKSPINPKISTVPIIQSAFDRSYALTLKHIDDLLGSVTPMELYSEINNEITLQELDDLDDVLRYMAREEMKLLHGKNPRIQLTNILMNM